MCLAEAEPKNNCLVVDDDENTRFFIRHILVKNGFAVSEVSSGEEAILRISESGVFPEVIILDQMMPGIDGISTLKKIRSMEGSDYTAVIIVTSTRNHQVVIDALQNGAFDFIIKPITPRNLAESVRRAILKLGIKKRATTSMVEGMETPDQDLRLQTVTQVGKALTYVMGNPLQAILSSAEMMSKNGGDNQNKEKIERNVFKILSILGKFSNATSLKNTKVFMNDEMIDVKTVESIDLNRVI